MVRRVWQVLSLVLVLPAAASTAAPAGPPRQPHRHTGEITAALSDQSSGVLAALDEKGRAFAGAISGATETAHFKPPPVDAAPAQDLVINLQDPEANLATLDILWDIERPPSASAAQLDLNDKSTIDGSVEASPLTPLGAQALSDIAAGTP